MIARLFRLLSGPLDMTTKRACMASPRLVVISHRFSSCSHLADLGLEAGQTIEVEVLADATRMRTDLIAEAVLLLGDVAGLFQQRQVDVAFDVALCTWISIPVPGAAEVAAF